MRIGVLALQGAFLEHEQMLHKLGTESIEIRQRADLKGIDGLILPGGESTVQGQLLDQLQLKEPLRELIMGGLPVLATCAGLILLAQEIEGEEKSHLATLPVRVKRNAYGRQLGSFQAQARVGELADFPLVFIRGPYISQMGEGVEPLCQQEGKLVGVSYQRQIALAFHPELTGDCRIHEQFLAMVEESMRREKS